MPRVKHTKKIIPLTEIQKSPYVIRLGPVPEVEEKIHDELPRTVTNIKWTDVVARSLYRPPRIDFSNGTTGMETMTSDIVTPNLVDERPSRWRAVFHESTIGEWLAIARIPRIIGTLWTFVSPVVVRIPRVYVRSLATFMIVAVVLVAPLGVLEAFDRMSAFQRVIMHGIGPIKENSAAIIRYVQAGEWGSASLTAHAIAAQFVQLEQSMESIPTVIRRPLTLIPSLRSSEELVKNGSVASKVIADVIADIAKNGLRNPMDTLHRQSAALMLLRDRARSIEQDFATIRSSSLTPSNVSTYLGQAGEMLASSLGSLDQFVFAADAIDRSAGWDQPRRYLILFQNPHEMRAIGGFLGSYGILEMHAGRVTSFSIPPEGSYGINGNLAYALESPEPLRLINSRWQFQDANWWPDWPTTAEKILWFWDASQQPSVDGVIAVNGTVFEDMLRILGPVVTKDRRVILAVDSALQIIETSINDERTSDHRRQPKKILGLIAEALQERVGHMTSDEQRKVALALVNALQRREILVMSRIPEVQERIIAMKLDGSTERSSRDYLMVVHSNIGGRKTDAVMENSTAYSVFIQPDGTAIATVTIERTHHGERGSPLTGAPNKDYIRFYVPEGSQFVDVWGFTVPPKEQFEIPLGVLRVDEDLKRIERDRTRDARTGTDIYRENGKTVFGQWLWTKLGERSSAGIRYVLPFRVAPPEGKAGVVARLVRSFRDDPLFVPYDLAIVRQPGMSGALAVNITTPPAWETAWRYPMTITTSPSTMQWNGNFDSDLWFGAVWKR